jgi:two-component system, chemotaxis family, chemotaxis protein CheY
MASLLLEGVSVLVVEDQTELREGYAFWLAHMGASISTAENAIDAYALLRNGLTPTVVLTDFHMPGMDGVTFLRSVRDELGSRIPLVAITGDVLAASRLAGAGFDACLVKPVSGQVVADTIARVSAPGHGAA